MHDLPTVTMTSDSKRSSIGHREAPPQNPNRFLVRPDVVVGITRGFSKPQNRPGGFSISFRVETPGPCKATWCSGAFDLNDHIHWALPRALAISRGQVSCDIQL